MPRTFLLVAHLTPPSPLSAARRPGGFAKHLARRGHRVIVLTSALSGPGPMEGAARVVRTRDLMRSRFNWRRGSFDVLEGRAGPSDALPPSRLEGLVVPDLALVTWLPFALPAARRLVARERPDAVWTTGPPPSTNLIGAALGLPWVADVRDGWRFERNHGDFPTRAQRALDLALERRMARRATRMTAVTEPIAADLRERLGARSAATISNGFDLDELAPLNGAPPPGLLAGERHTLLYTGRLAYVKRSPAPLLEGLRALKRADPEAAAGIEVVFAGPLQAEERAQIEAADLEGITRTLGSLDRETTMRLQRAADTLLLITTGNPSETGQKLFEYLAADRPVLVVGDRTEAARIVAEAGAGGSVPLEDPEAIARGIADLVRAGRRPAEGAIARQFDYESLAAQLEDELERAIDDHGVRR